MPSQKRRKLDKASSGSRSGSTYTIQDIPSRPRSNVRVGRTSGSRDMSYSRFKQTPVRYLRGTSRKAESYSAENTAVAPAVSLPPPNPKDITDFENTNLVHQKRLKVNNSQLTKVLMDFNELKARYLTTCTIPPSTTAAFREHIRSQLETYCKRHDGLLEVRQDMLGKQQSWLEGAFQVKDLGFSDRLLVAIEMQIEAAKDLDGRQKQGALMQELATT